MKKIVMTAACFALGGMLTASMAGEGCKKGCGEGEEAEIISTSVFCGGDKKADDDDAGLIGEIAIFCGGEKKGCGDDADS